ncbi:hypothetical protein QUF90_22400 [Desulfococcaceae bacterium HSG9]|nr:hypothetical protein [Desulfococcaceae bacterium HSG9]
MMYAKHFIVTLMLGLMLCFGAVVEASEKPADAKTETADQAQPAASATPAEKKKVAAPKAAAPTVPAAKTENADDATPEAFVPQKRFTFTSEMDGAKVMHDFIIQNKGDAPLKITKVKTG